VAEGTPVNRKGSSVRRGGQFNRLAGFRVSPTEVTRIPARSTTGHLVSQMPQPMHSSVSTTGTFTGAPPLPGCSRKTIAFFGVGQCSSQTMHGVPGRRDAPPRVDEGEPDHGLVLLLHGELPDGGGRANLPAQGAVVLAVADPRHQDGAPDPLDPRFEQGGLQPPGDAHLHAFAAPHAPGEELVLPLRPRGADERRGGKGRGGVVERTQADAAPNDAAARTARRPRPRGPSCRARRRTST